MSDLMTMEEIESTYDGEWVVLADVESDPGPILRRGRVIWHGKDHEEAWARSYDTDSRHIAVFYVGDWSGETEPIPVL
jgi:hypothetical protein